MRLVYSRRLSICVLLALVSPLLAIEHVQFRHRGKRHSVDGKILLEASNLLVLKAPDGRIWNIEPDEILRRETDGEREFAPLNQKQLIQQTLGELPKGFQVHKTAHYLVFFNTSRAYAQWCGSLYERLYRAFNNYWRRRGLKLNAPETPLVAIVFDNAQQYQEFSRDELGDARQMVIGFYSLRTNWITTYDLTGLEELRQSGPRPKNSVVVNQILSQPAAEPNVATLIHEATHQIAFNSGMQTRFGENPLWISEGLAVFFEVPDLSSKKGWKRIGAVNLPRLLRLQKTQPNRGPGWLRALIVNDDRLRNRNTAVTGYAETWALCHFLINRKQGEFIAYLADIADEPLMVVQNERQRLAKFIEHFGDPRALESEVFEYLNELRW